MNWIAANILGNEQVINYILGFVVTAAVTWGTTLLHKYLNITVDEKSKNDWKAAVLTVARAAILNYGGSIFDIPKASEIKGIKTKVIEEAKLSVPGAVKHFGFDKPNVAKQVVMDNLAAAAIKQAIDETVMAKAAVDVTLATSSGVKPPFTAPPDRNPSFNR